MLDALKDFYEVVSIIDLIYLIITTLSLIKCYRKGFVLSLLAASKWILAYVITLFLSLASSSKRCCCSSNCCLALSTNHNNDICAPDE